MLVVLDQRPNPLRLRLKMCSETFSQVNYLTGRVSIWHAATGERLHTSNCDGRDLRSLCRPAPRDRRALSPGGLQNLHELLVDGGCVHVMRLSAV